MLIFQNWRTSSTYSYKLIFLYEAHTQGPLPLFLILIVCKLEQPALSTLIFSKWMYQQTLSQEHLWRRNHLTSNTHGVVNGEGKQNEGLKKDRWSREDGVGKRESESLLLHPDSPMHCTYLKLLLWQPQKSWPPLPSPSFWANTFRQQNCKVDVHGSQHRWKGPGMCMDHGTTVSGHWHKTRPLA